MTFRHVVDPTLFRRLMAHLKVTIGRKPRYTACSTDKALLSTKGPTGRHPGRKLQAPIGTKVVYSGTNEPDQRTVRE